jgi:hypothetical protein
MLTMPGNIFHSGLVADPERYHAWQMGIDLMTFTYTFLGKNGVKSG